VKKNRWEKWKKTKNQNQSRLGGIFLADESEKVENEAMKLEFEKEKEEIKEEADKRKKDDVWAGKNLIFIYESLHKYYLSHQYRNKTKSQLTSPTRRRPMFYRPLFLAVL
jgi:hypothetical protein